jgi:hypothetical protein
MSVRRAVGILQDYYLRATMLAWGGTAEVAMLRLLARHKSALGYGGECISFVLPHHDSVLHQASLVLRVKVESESYPSLKFRPRTRTFHCNRPSLYLTRQPDAWATPSVVRLRLFVIAPYLNTTILTMSCVQLCQSFLLLMRE